MRALDVSGSDVLAVLGYVALGFAGTAITVIGVVYLLRPLQPVVYDAFYLLLGPWTATEAAVIFHLAVAGVPAIGLPTLVAELLGGQHPRTVTVGVFALLVALVAVFVVTALLGLLSFLTVLVAYVLLVAAALAGLVTSDAATGSRLAFGGGVPVLALLLVLLAFGLGWGGGYDVVAEPLPGHDASDDVPDFEDAPAVAEDLFDQQHCDPGDGGCRLPLRGYEHERRAARFLDANGVRCPFVNAPTTPVYDRDASFVAEYDGDYYRISCQAYGD
jgi:hypothetical protein